MEQYFARLFSQNNSDLAIGLFDVWHFLYLFIIFGTAFLTTFLMRRRSDVAKDRVLRIFAYLTIGLYIADFFIMPLSDSYSGISVYKLPFNVCTLMAVMVPFVQFNKKLEFIRPAIVTISMASSLMWMFYPGSALGGQPPFSYIIFQTFMYHGLLFCWGFLSVSLGRVRLSIGRIWREGCVILFILGWAAFGNAVYPGQQNWFFIESSIFPFLPDSIMPVMVVFSVSGVCIIIYGIYYLTLLINKAIKKKMAQKQTV